MAARLLLGELFVHGIGGAKYDQLTDRIIEQFFGLQPPGYLVASGTLRLPVSQSNAATESVHQIRQRIRELDFHPERFLDQRTASSKAANGGKPQQSQGDTAALVSEKRRLLATPASPETARQRCRALRQINENLQPAVAELRELWSSQAKLQSNRERVRSTVEVARVRLYFVPGTDLDKIFAPGAGKLSTDPVKLGRNGRFDSPSEGIHDEVSGPRALKRPVGLRQPQSGNR